MRVKEISIKHNVERTADRNILFKVNPLKKHLVFYIYYYVEDVTDIGLYETDTVKDISKVKSSELRSPNIYLMSLHKTHDIFRRT